MPSTYSSNLRIELIASGEQANQWGITTNTNLGTLIEQAIAGLASIDVTAGDVTLTALNGTTDQSRQMVLSVTGTPGVARYILAPAVSKVYVVANDSTEDVDIITTAVGSLGVTVTPGT
jgi:pantothenate kinase